MAAEGTPGPDQTAWAWLEAIRAQDPERLWRLMDPDFRLVNAQGWITMNPEALGHPTVARLDRDTFARELSLENPSHPLWPQFAKVMLREVTQACGGFEHKDLRIGSRPRLIAPELELVRLFPVDELDQDATGQYYFAPGASAVTLSVILRHRGAAWLVAGMGDSIGYPGWPPRFERVVQPDD